MHNSKYNKLIIVIIINLLIIKLSGKMFDYN